MIADTTYSLLGTITNVIIETWMTMVMSEYVRLNSEKILERLNQTPKSRRCLRAFVLLTVWLAFLRMNYGFAVKIPLEPVQLALYALIIYEGAFALFWCISKEKTQAYLRQITHKAPFAPKISAWFTLVLFFLLLVGCIIQSVDFKIVPR